jgi:hypothetical protein
MRLRLSIWCSGNRDGPDKKTEVVEHRIEGTLYSLGFEVIRYFRAEVGFDDVRQKLHDALRSVGSERPWESRHLKDIGSKTPGGIGRRARRPRRCRKEGRRPEVVGQSLSPSEII